MCTTRHNSATQSWTFCICSNKELVAESRGASLMGMEMPLPWHRRQAIVLASQLPDNTADAVLVIQALTDLVNSFLVAHEGEDRSPSVGSNILPFTG